MGTKKNHIHFLQVSSSYFSSGTTFLLLTVLDSGLYGVLFYATHMGEPLDYYEKKLLPFLRASLADIPCACDCRKFYPHSLWDQHTFKKMI